MDAALLGLLAAALFVVIGMLGTALFGLRAELRGVRAEIAQMRVDLARIEQKLDDHIAVPLATAHPPR